MTSLASVIKVKSSERLTVIGKTGSGKSKVALACLDTMHNVIVIDPKHEIERAGYVVMTTEKELERAGTTPEFDRVIFRPPVDWEKEDWNRFFLWVYKRRNTVVYVDEVSTIDDNAHAYPKYQKICYVQGRSMNIGMWATNQDPVSIPRFILSQAEHLIIFYQSMPDYQRYIDELAETRINWGYLATNPHDFYYVRRGQMPQGPFKLKL